VPPPDGGASSSGATTSSSGTTSSGGSDAGACGLYGQQCSTNADCCNEVPCTSVAGSPCAAGQSGCTCHYPVQ
jgi:hypothetical protein